MYQYNCMIKFNNAQHKLSYSIKDRTAHYLFKGRKKTISVNPLTAYDDIVMDIADDLFIYFPEEKY